ncbi:hypothetical protein AGMMS49546_08160 [Spirochaetia bacterium]|nr:hypothetical protein AGMMS49546_08160 [Spirochaetia bacterium]
MKRKRAFSIIHGLAVLIISFLLAGCAGLAERGGKILDKSDQGEKISARYRYAGSVDGIRGFEFHELKNRAGKSSTIIVLDQFPTVKLRGTPPDSSGNFHLTSLEYLGGTLSGWNEFTLELSAEGNFKQQPDGSPALSLFSPLMPVRISAGKIRRSGSRISGEEALTSLRNRYDRIQALVEWMKEQEGVPATVLMGQRFFEVYWKPILLPELLPKKQRPPSWQEEGAQWNLAEDIRWNVTYTEGLMNEELRPLRNSGALLRDWEEAPEWIYLEYAWNSIESALQEGITMGRIIKK